MFDAQICCMPCHQLASVPPRTTNASFAKQGVPERALPTPCAGHSLQLLDNQRWLEQFHADAERLTDEDLNTEPEAW